MRRAYFLFRQPLASPFLVGLLNRPIRIHAQNRVEVIGVKCYPWAVFELLGQLQAPLAQWIQAGQVAEALATVAQYFVQARSQLASDPLLGKAGGAMRATGGTLPVTEVAAAAHTTVRTL